MHDIVIVFHYLNWEWVHFKFSIPDQECHSLKHVWHDVHDVQEQLVGIYWMCRIIAANNSLISHYENLLFEHRKPHFDDYRQSCLFTLLRKITAVVVITFGGYRKGRTKVASLHWRDLQIGNIYIHVLFWQLSQTKEEKNERFS